MRKSLISMDPDIATPESSEKEASGSVFVLQYENTNEKTVEAVLQHTKAQYHAGHVVCLGAQSTTLGSSQPVLTSSEYYMRLLRQYSLHSNERQMLLGEDDNMIAVQLCLAELNKKVTGDFDVEVSKVLEFTRRLQDTKLRDDGDNKNLDTSISGPDHSILSADVDFENFLTQYSEFLSSNNYLDLMDLGQKVRSEVNVNEELMKAIKGDSFLLLDTPRSPVEKYLMRLLLENKSIYWVHIAESLSPDSETESVIQPDQIMVEPTSLEDVLNTTSTGSHSVGKRSSLTEAYVEKLMYGYLHLLVNSRSELALARVINVPERELDHKAFTDVKHMAQAKGLSMYQTVSSFVMKLRINRSFIETDNPLLNHVKGLSEFTDMMHQLQNIIEEELNTGLAVKRVLNVIKNTIIKCRDTMVRRASVEAARDHLQTQADWVLSEMDKIGDSPSRAVSAGGSLMGRQALRVIRYLLDHTATQPPVTSALNTLTDIVSSQKTPLRFPSVMSQFRSPLECSPEAVENKSLVQRMKERFPVKKPVRAQYGSSLDWAKPLHSTGLTQSPQSPITLHDYVPNSKTIVHPGANFIQRRPLETLFDQENADCSPQPVGGATCKATSTAIATTPRRPLASHSNNVALAKPTSSKRALQDSDNTSKPSKRAKVQSSQSSQPSQAKKTKAKSKKAIPLQKGQKTLGAFFRI